MWRILMLSLVFSWLVSCTSQTIYLSQVTDQPEQVILLKEQLQVQGYKVELSHVALPEQHDEVVIAKNPGFFDSDYLHGIKALLHGQGFSDIATVSFGEGNHFYSDHNIGIYLPDTLPRLPPVMHGSDCGGFDAILEATADKQLQIELSANDEQQLELEFDGYYRMLGQSNGQMNVGGSLVRFELRHKQVDTYAGLRTAAELAIVASEHRNIPVGCTLLTIFD